jgi:sulfatase modifying factor 1
MYYYKKIIFVLVIFIFPKISNAFVNEKINFEKFSLNKYEITIQEFKKYAEKIIYHRGRKDRWRI